MNDKVEELSFFQEIDRPVIRSNRSHTPAVDPPRK